MRRDVEQDFTFRHGFAHQAEFEILQITQAAVDQLAAGRGRGARQIALFTQGDAQTPPGGVSGHAGAVDAAADDQQVMQQVLRRVGDLGCHGPRVPPIGRAVAPLETL